MSVSPQDLVGVNEGLQKRLQEGQHLRPWIWHRHFLWTDVDRTASLQQAAGLLKVLWDKSTGRNTEIKKTIPPHVLSLASLDPSWCEFWLLTDAAFSSLYTGLILFMMPTLSPERRYGYLRRPLGDKDELVGEDVLQEAEEGEELVWEKRGRPFTHLGAAPYKCGMPKSPKTVTSTHEIQVLCMYFTRTFPRILHVTFAWLPTRKTCLFHTHLMCFWCVFYTWICISHVLLAYFYVKYELILQVFVAPIWRDEYHVFPLAAEHYGHTMPVSPEGCKK